VVGLGDHRCKSIRRVEADCASMCKPTLQRLLRHFTSAYVTLTHRKVSLGERLLTRATWLGR
jgi:hypothetical protein